MIALITPTGARPIQFNLCKLFMERQTYTGAVAWFIIDDAVPRSTDNIADTFRPNWTIHKLYPTPHWAFGMNTQARNINAGLIALMSTYNSMEIEAIFIIEDDDYYKPMYLERMMLFRGDNWAFGERNTIYYNVLYRRYITNANTLHASLFQTALTWEGIPYLIDAFKDKFIDGRFWNTVKNKFLFNDGDLAIGIKGQPGRGGIGAGHSRAMNMLPDPELRHLVKLIGTENATLYEGHYSYRGQSQYPLLARKRL